jgi:hypothetical protein
LEDLVAQIDAPLLDTIATIFFHQLIFDIPQLAQFMRRTARFQAINEAHVVFDLYNVEVGSLPPGHSGEQPTLQISCQCRELDWQLSSLAQVFPSFFPSIYMLEHLYIYRPRYSNPRWQDDIENMQWLEVFQPLTAVKNLYVVKDFAQPISLALQELVGERVTEVLPALESLSVEELQPTGPVQKAFGQFVAARQLLGHPVAVSQSNVNVDWIYPQF